MSQQDVVKRVKKSFDCPVCEKIYKTRAGLTYHVKTIHEKKEFQYVCVICEAAVIGKSGLKQHITMMHGEKKNKAFKCNIYEAGFKLEHLLEKASPDFNFEC